MSYMEEKGYERACKRFPHYATVAYVPSRRTGAVAQKGLTINRSVQGMCLFVFQPLDTGEKIVITSDSRDGICDKEGTIMWTKQVAKEMFKVGLNLCEVS